jgi:hypothetical protein
VFAARVGGEHFDVAYGHIALIYLLLIRVPST